MLEAVRIAEEAAATADELGFNITRADIAAFIAAQIDNNRYVGRAPAMSN